VYPVNTLAVHKSNSCSVSVLLTSQNCSYTIGHNNAKSPESFTCIIYYDLVVVGL